MNKIFRIIISLVCMALLAAWSLPGAFAASSPEQKAVRMNVLKPGPSINVVAPKAGDSFNAGSQVSVIWTPSHLSGTVRIFLYKTGVPVGGFPLVSMISTESVNNTFQWNIDAGLTPGNDYTIVVESNEKPNVKGVSAAFTLLPPKKGGPPKLGSDANKTILTCPEKISVGVMISQKDIKTVSPGFVPGDLGNINSDFHFVRNGKQGDKECYCEYSAGKNIFARIFADMYILDTCDKLGEKYIVVHKK